MRVSDRFSLVMVTSLFLTILASTSESTLGQTPVPIGREFVVSASLDYQVGRTPVAVDDARNFAIYWSEFLGGYGGRSGTLDGSLGPTFDIEPTSYHWSNRPFDAIALGQEDFGLLRELQGDAIEFYRHGLDGDAQLRFDLVTATDMGADWVVTPWVANHAKGQYAAAWTAGIGTSWEVSDVFFRLFDPAGGLGSIIPINELTVGQQSYPAIDAHTDGALVAAWRSDGSVGPDNDGLSIQGRIFFSPGDPSDQFQVNTTSFGDQSSVAIAFAAEGSFLIVWQGLATPGDSWTHIWSQAYELDGTALGPEQQLSLNRDGSQRRARVAAYDDGFLVVWTLAGQEILGRVVDKAGLPKSGVARLDELVILPGGPALASRSQNEVLVAWPRQGTSGGPVSARAFRSFLFRDGFESGDVSAWSESVP